MFRILALTAMSLATTLATAAPIVVNCDAGQSLNRTLSSLPRNSTLTVLVQGTCTEYVHLDGFEGLTVRGIQGATLQQPSTDPKTGLIYLVTIFASRGVTFSGLTLHSRASAFSSIAVAFGSSDIQLRDLRIDGPWGILTYRGSQVDIRGVTINITSGYAAIAAWDKSDVHVANCTLRGPSDSSWHAGLHVASGHVTIQGTTIRDMKQGIVIDTSGSVDVVNFDTALPSTDVLITNPASGNYTGVQIANSSSLNISSARLLIENAGQSWGGTTAAVAVDGGSTLSAGANLVVTNARGQGVIVSNNSHAYLAGSSVTGGLHGGLVAVNLSTISVDATTPLTTVSANGSDLFCDSRSQIAGALNIVGSGTVQCGNLLPGTFENLP